MHTRHRSRKANPITSALVATLTAGGLSLTFASPCLAATTHQGVPATAAILVKTPPDRCHSAC